MEQIHPREQRARDLFDVLTFDDENNIFYMQDGAVGFGVICAPLAGGGPKQHDAMNGLLTLSYPTNTVLQVSLFSSPDLEPSIHHYEALRRDTSDPILRRITEDRVSYLRDHTKTPLDQLAGVRLHNTQVMFTVKIPYGKRGIRNETQWKELTQLKDSFEQSLKNIGFSHSTLTAESYRRFMQTVLNHGPRASWRDEPVSTHEDTIPLCHQLLDPDNPLEVEREGMQMGKHAFARLLHVKRYPSCLQFGKAMEFLGNVLTGDRGIRETCLITTNVLFVDHESWRSKLELNKAWAINAEEKKASKYSERYQQRASSLRSVMSAVEGGDRIVQTYLGMAVFGKDKDDAVRAGANARSYFRQLGFQLLEDECSIEPLLGSLCPFGTKVGLNRFYNRYITLATRHAAKLLPIMGSWRGTGTPLLTLYSRDGQLMPISPFDTESNPNVVIAAASGKGKSFLINDMIANFRAMNGRAWVLDLGHSYKQLCDLLGGYYFEFDTKTNVCLNPFSLVTEWDPQEMAVVVGVITSMATPKEPLSNIQVAALQRVVSKIWERYGREASIDAVASLCLAQKDQRITDLGTMLFPYTSKGIYGSYFNGNNNFDIDNNFIVCELEQLKGQEQLQRVVLQQMMYQVQQEIYGGDRAVKKMLMLDEAWDLLSADHTAEFIVGCYRRIRKYGGFVGAVTQNVSDLYISKATQAIMDNSANLYLLGQKPEAIQALKKSGQLSFGSDFGFTLLESVHTVKGEYSEILCKTDHGMGVGRLSVSEFNKALYSTNPEDVAAIRRMRAQGVGVEEAVTRLAQGNVTRIGAAA